MFNFLFHCHWTPGFCCILLQKYLQSTTVRVEEMRVKRRDAEQWMSHRMLPEHLRERIRRYEHYKWQENRGVEEETLIHDLPKDLRRDIKRHLCLELLKKVGIISSLIITQSLRFLVEDFARFWHAYVFSWLVLSGISKNVFS